MKPFSLRFRHLFNCQKEIPFRRARSGNRDLGFEPLEPRQLLANDFLLTWATGLMVGDSGTNNGGIFVSQPDGQDMRQITVSQTHNFEFSGDGLNLPDDHPSFSPDGTQIVFTTSRYQAAGEVNNFEIAIMNVDGTNVRRLTNSPGLDTEPVFSPDGTRIAFASERSGNLDIWSMNVDGAGLLRLTSFPEHENEPAFSHSGNQISFTRILFGGVLGIFAAEKDIYIMNADGSNKQLIAGTDKEEHDAVWSLDDKSLIITSEVGGTLPFGDVQTIEIATKQYKNNLTIDDRFLFIGGGGDATLSPDGTKIAYFKATGGPLLLAGPQKIHVMNANGTNKVKINAPGFINVHPHFGKLADSDLDGKPDYLDIDSPADLNQALIQDEARVVAMLGTLTTINGAVDMGRMALIGYLPAHSFDSFQGMGVAFVRDVDDSEPSVLGIPDVLLYQPDLNGVFGQRDPTDIQPDFNYTLIGWGYATKYNPKQIPGFGGFPEDLWLVHEAGFHPVSTGTFEPTTPAGDSPRGTQPGHIRPTTNLLTPWHPRLWDIHFFRRPGGGTPIAAIHDPFGRNLPGNPTGSNTFFYPQIPWQGAAQDGTLVEAEEFDMARGIGWNDLSAGNSGNAYRITDVDITPSLENVTGYDVFNFQAGEFLQYTLDLPTTAVHDFTFRIRNSAIGSKFHIEVDGVNRSGTLDMPLTGANIKSPAYESFSPFSTFLLKGKHRIRLVFESVSGGSTASGLRFDSFSVTPKSVPTATMDRLLETVTPADFTDLFVTFQDNSAIDVGALDGLDVRVTGPNGFSQLATLVNKTESSDTARVTGTYRVLARGTGWDSADNGVYSLQVNASQVRDVTGVFVPQQQLGSFVVDIAPFELIEDFVTHKSTLYVSGSESDDLISLIQSGGTITVRRNNQVLGTASALALNKIVIGTVGGNDTVHTSGVTVPMIIRGGAGNDSLQGGTQNDSIYGDSGDDTLLGGSGDDLLFGGDGNDTLRGEDGNDTLDGGSGNNVLDEGPGQGGIRLTGTPNRDVILIDRRVIGGTVYAVIINNGKESRQVYRNGETIIVHAGDGDDHVELIGEARVVWAADFRGGRGNDVLIGGVRDDRIRGGGGNDLLIGGTGIDRLWGGSGNDTIIGGAGDDYLLGGRGDDWIYGGDGRDWLNGNDGDDWLYGEGGNDLLLGGRGRDRLFGGWGNDVLLGGSDRDWLFGESGDDLLFGGSVAFENDPAALGRLLYLWGYGQLLEHRISATGSLIDRSKFAGDNAIDELFGQGGRDWFIDFELQDLKYDLFPDPRFGDRLN